MKHLFVLFMLLLGLGTDMALPPGWTLPAGLREVRIEGEDGPTFDYVDVNGQGGYSYNDAGQWGRWNRDITGYDEGGGEMLGASYFTPYTATQDFAAATPGATLQDMKWWGTPNTAVNGSSADKWISPTGAQPTVVRGPDGSLMMQLPGDAQSAGTVTDSDTHMSLWGEMAPVLAGPVFGMTGAGAYLNNALGPVGAGAARGALVSGIAGGNPLLGAATGGAGASLASLLSGPPSLPEGEMYADSGDIMSDAGGDNWYDYLPSGDGTPYGPLEGGGNLFDYNYLPGGGDQPFGPLPTGGNLYDFLPDNSTPSGPTPNGGNIDGEYGGLSRAQQIIRALLGGGAAAGVAGSGGANPNSLSSLLKSLGLDTGSYGGAVDAFGRAIPGLVGAYAANEQSKRLMDLANEYKGFQAPSRARYEASMAPGFDPMGIPGYKTAIDNSMESMLYGLSTQGNPFGNPSGLIDANKRVVAGTAMPAIQNYQQMNATAGGIGNTNAALPGLQSGAIGAAGNVTNALGAAAADVFTTKDTTLADLLKKMQGNNIFGTV